MIFQEYDRNLIWSEENYTFDASMEHNQNSIGLILNKADLTNAKTITIYDGNDICHEEATEYRQNVSDEDLIKVCDMMSDLTSDFGDSILGWAKAMNGHTFDQIGDFRENPAVLTQVMDTCGSGFTKLFVLFHKTIQNPDVMFLHNPGASLHPQLSAAVLKYLSYYNKHTQFVVTDAREFVSLREYWCELD